MTEKRFIVIDRWIRDNCIGTWLNIDFNTIAEANLCCNLLNQIEKEKRNNGKLATQFLEENEQLKKTISMYSDATKSDMREIKELMQDIEEIQKENEQLKQQLFETKKDYILETYADNPVRRDEKLKALEKELEE